MTSPLLKFRTRTALKFFWTGVELPRRLAHFQAVEADGVWHLQRILERTTGENRIQIFNQIIEEMSHADQFSALAKRNSLLPVSFPRTERNDLFPTNEPTWKTVAFVHVGEVDATRQFHAIAESLPEGELRSSLTRILGDESGHVDLTDSIGRSLGATPLQMKVGILKVRFRRFWESRKRFGQNVGDFLVNLGLSGIYWAIVPIFYPIARAYLNDGTKRASQDGAKRMIS